MKSGIYEKRQRWKFFLFISAILIGAGSLFYTRILVKDLSFQEKEKLKLWAEAERQLINSHSPDADLGFQLMVVENNTTIPVILTDSALSIINRDYSVTSRGKE